MEFLAIILFVALIWHIIKLHKIDNELKATQIHLKDLQDQFTLKSQEFIAFKDKTAHLEQYEIIDDAKLEAQSIILKAEERLKESENKYHQKILEAQVLASEELLKARTDANNLNHKAELKIQEAHNLASKIEIEANLKAQETARSASEAKEKE